MASTSRQVGGTLGVAVLGALAGGGRHGAIGPGFAADTHARWWVLVGLDVVLLVLAFFSTTDWASGTARRTAESLREDPRPAALRTPAGAGCLTGRLSASPEPPGPPATVNEPMELVPGRPNVELRRDRAEQRVVVLSAPYDRDAGGAGALDPAPAL